jgi:hypothetical protein
MVSKTSSMCDLPLAEVDMLARRAAFETSALLCANCRRSLYQTAKCALTPILLPRRRLHTSRPSSMGLLELIKTERHLKYVHKEIGKILEHYDIALDAYYTSAKESVPHSKTSKTDLHEYHKYYLSGSRKDLLYAFGEIARLHRLTTRVAEYIRTNEFLQRTQVPDIFEENEIQQQAKRFLKAIEGAHGDDKQYQYIMKEINTMKVEPLAAVEKPLSNARVAGWFLKILNWIRNREVRILRTEYERTLEMVYYHFSEG